MRRILLLGNLKGAPKAALESACRQLGALLTPVSRADDAMREIDHRDWYAVLVDITTPGASRFCHEARARRALFNVPMLGLTPQPSDLAFSNALRWGADDVVPLGSAQAITARLGKLPERAPLVDPKLGEAVIADSDRGRCDVLGRVLANAGYNVRYATDIVATRFYLTKNNVRLFVLNSELGPAAELIAEARQANNPSPWVVTAKQLDLATLRTQLASHSGVAVMGSHGPPENVLFALDFLNPSEHAHQRAETRALYGTMVLFRPEGEIDDECGYTYSVSASGLYVRTLAPAPNGRLWFELEPPNAGRRVRLVGEVVRARRFGEVGEQTAPPGFGVRIVAGLGSDMEEWLSGFQTLAGDIPDAHRVPEVKVSSPAFRVPLPSTLSLRPALHPGGAATPGKLKRTPVIPVRTNPSNEIPAAVPTERGVAPASNTVAPAQPTSSAATATTETATVNPAKAEPSDKTSAETSLIKTTPIETAATQAIPAKAELYGSISAETNLTKTAPIETAATAAALAKTTAIAQLELAPTPPKTPTPPKEAELSNFNAGNTLRLAPEPSANAAPARAQAPAPPSRRRKTRRSSIPPAPSAAPPPQTFPKPQSFPKPQPSSKRSGAPPSERITSPALSAATRTRLRPIIPAVAGVLALLIVTGVIAVSNDWFSLNSRAQPEQRLSSQGAAPNTAQPELTAGKDQPAAELQPPAPAPAPDTPASASAAKDAVDPPASAAVPAGSGAPGPAAASAAPGPNEPVSGLAPAPSEPSAAASSVTPELKPAPPTPSPDSLADDEAWLLVRSSLAANVYVHGLHLGVTNEWMRSKCNMRFVRLGQLPGEWISEGVPQKLPCKGHYVMQLEAAPPPPSE